MASDLEENHPRVMANIIEFWGYKDGTEYLDHLLLMDRGGRHGFDYEVMSDLIMLSAVHDQITKVNRHGL